MGIRHCISVTVSETHRSLHFDIYQNILPAFRAEWPTWLLLPLAQAQPPPPLVLLLPWHFPYSQGTHVPRPAGGFSHTSVPCFPIPLYYKTREMACLQRSCMAHYVGILLFKSENSYTNITHAYKYMELTTVKVYS